MTPLCRQLHNERENQLCPLLLSSVKLTEGLKFPGLVCVQPWLVGDFCLQQQGGISTFVKCDSCWHQKGAWDTFKGAAFNSWMQIQRNAIYPWNHINIPCWMTGFSPHTSIKLFPGWILVTADKRGIWVHQESGMEPAWVQWDITNASVRGRAKGNSSHIYKQDFYHLKRVLLRTLHKDRFGRFFLIAAMSLPSCLVKDELMLFDKLILATGIIPIQPSHTIQFKTA